LSFPITNSRDLSILDLNDAKGIYGSFTSTVSFSLY